MYAHVYARWCMYTVHCTTYTIQRTMYNVQRTTYNIQRTLLYNVQRTMYIHTSPYNVRHIMYAIQCTSYNVLHTIYDIQFTTYNVCYEIYTIRDSHKELCSTLSESYNVVVNCQWPVAIQFHNKEWSVASGQWSIVCRQ